MLIENYLQKELFWQSLFLKFQFRKEYEQDKELKPLIDFLCEKVSFWYCSDVFNENPFSPFADFTFSGRGRTSNITDLSNDDLIIVRQCIEHTENHLILGFLTDILGWTQDSKENKLLAARHYIEYSKYLLNNKEYQRHALQPIERAFALMCQLKDTKEIELFVDEFLSYSHFEEHREYPFKVSLIEMFYARNQKTYSKILPYAENLYEKYVSDSEYIWYSIQLSKIILNIYKSHRDKINIKKWATAYAQNCCNVDTTMPQIEQELDNAIAETDRLNDFELTNKLRIKKKQLQEDFYKSFNMQPMPFTAPDKVSKEMMAFRNIIIDKLKVLDGISQICFFLSRFSALSKKEIEKQLKQKDQFSIIDLVNQIRFNEKNEIIFQSATASEKQKTENKIYEIYQLHDAIVFDIIINPFVYYAKLDDECISFMSGIVNHNELVYRNHNVIIQHIRNGIYEKRIRSALSGLLPQFEDGMRHYIEKQGIMPVIRSGGNEIKASLGQMMNNDVFRKYIDELIGEDLSQHIDYLACKELGADLRNKFAHEGYGDDSQFSIDEVSLFFLLIKAYCMGYDDEIISTQ